MIPPILLDLLARPLAINALYAAPATSVAATALMLDLAVMGGAGS